MKPLNKEKKPKVVSITIFTGCLIGLFVIILSVAHCAALFTRAGYHGILSYIGVAAFELTFLLGTGILIYSKWKGEKVGRASRFVLIIGVLINLYSNVTSGIAQDGKPLVFWNINGMEINEAVLIGALIPLLIVMAEMVVSDAITKTRTKFNQPSTVSTKNSTNESTTSTTSTNEINQNNEVNHRVDESTNEIIQEKEIVHEVIQPVDGSSNHNVNQPVVQPTSSTNSTTSTKSSKSSNHSVNHTINHPTSDSTNNSTTRPVKDNQPMDDVNQKEKSTNQQWLKADQPPSKPSKSTIQSSTSSNQSSKKSTTSSTNQPDDSTNGSTTNSTKLVDLSSNSSNNSTTSTTSTNQPKTPIDWALQYLDEHGELPSRRKLADLAGCTQHKAGNVLKKLREERKGDSY